MFVIGALEMHLIMMMGFSTGFCSRDLELDQMTFIYELDPYSLEVYRMNKNELSASRLLKVIRQTHTHTHTHTHRHDTRRKFYITPLRGRSAIINIYELRPFSNTVLNVETQLTEL